jgi:hypothetical protein
MLSYKLWNFDIYVNIYGFLNATVSYMLLIWKPTHICCHISRGTSTYMLICIGFSTVWFIYENIVRPCCTYRLHICYMTTSYMQPICGFVHMFKSKYYIARSYNICNMRWLYAFCHVLSSCMSHVCDFLNIHVTCMSYERGLWDYTWIPNSHI